jgi:hypothetical protein
MRRGIGIESLERDHVDTSLGAGGSRAPRATPRSCSWTCAAATGPVIWQPRSAPRDVRRRMCRRAIGAARVLLVDDHEPLAGDRCRTRGARGGRAHRHRRREAPPRQPRLLQHIRHHHCLPRRSRRAHRDDPISGSAARDVRRFEPAHSARRSGRRAACRWSDGKGGPHAGRSTCHVEDTTAPETPFRRASSPAG